MGSFVCGGTSNGVRLLAKDFLPQFTWCCAGAAVRGARSCTCWRPVYDLQQQRLDLSIVPETRSAMCGDCAYRPDSPERGSDPNALVDVEVFWCHRGIRRPVKWRHPDGRERDADAGDYRPPIHDAVPYRADGRPAARCGGWAQAQAAGR